MKHFQWVGVLGAIVLWLGAPAFANENQVWEFRSDYTYTDGKFSCKEHLPKRFSLVATVESGRVASAVFQKYSSPSKHDRVLTATELASFVLHQDYYGKYWIEEMTLESGTLLWVANQFTTYFCKLPQPLTSLKTTSLGFEFPMEKIGEEYLVTFTKPMSLKGYRKDGEMFELNFQFEQRRKDKEKR